MENKREEAPSFESQVENKYAELKDLPIIQEAFSFIENGLKEKYPEMQDKSPDVLPYHGRPHSEDVLHEATLFAISEGINDPKELELLAIAAAFHDSGFVKEYDNNEEFGAEFAGDYMQKNGTYNEQEIERVRRIILSTKVKFDPKFKQLIQDENDPLCKVMADADVSNFGRGDCFEKSEKVFQELLGLNKIPSDIPENREAFNRFREKMLQTHNWQTTSAQTLREEQKQKNLKTLSSSLPH